MTSFEETIDPALKAEFIDESLEGLDEIAELFIELENHPDDPEIIQAIFRPVHSIKGNSAYFGLLKTKSLAHEMETVLDLIRKGALSPTAESINVLLRGTDMLRAMLSRARNDEDEVLEQAGFDAMVREVNGVLADEVEDEESLWTELIAELHKDASAELITLARQLAQYTPAGRKSIGSEAEGQASIDSLPTPARKVYELMTAEFPPDPEEVMALLEESKVLAGSAEVVGVLDEAACDVQILNNSVGLGDPVAKDTLTNHLMGIATEASWTRQSAEENPPDSSAPEQSRAKPGEASKNSPARKVNKTMRIPEESIDVFLSHVGDLVTVGEMYTHLSDNLLSDLASRQAGIELRRINEAFNELSHALQASIMTIRKVPMNSILQRVPRMVRDVAAASGKQIDTRIVGGEIMVDKSLIDTLEAPLTHMVRNAADHGVETPEQREQAGKPSDGVIQVETLETHDDIVLTIKDDGKGLDRQALTRKAVELGMIGPEAQLTETDIINLLFKPGVSTAETVTDVSGRGVGMDVVRGTIEQMGGRIAVTSEPGRGSEFSVRLPKSVSTQILTGFIVVLDDNRYVFPMESIVRCFRPQPSDVVNVQGRGECVRDGERILRVCRLSEYFGEDRPRDIASRLQEGILVVIEAKGEFMAIHVDAIDGVRQVVLKDIDGLETTCELFDGGAVMGDGSIAMILNVDPLFATATTSKQATQFAHC